MNIKDLDIYKKEFKEILELVPISKLEFDIQNSTVDPLINILYHRLLSAEKLIEDPYYKNHIHKVGIIGIYGFLDVCYADVMRFILDGIDPKYINSKPHRVWRINLPGNHRTGGKNVE